MMIVLLASSNAWALNESPQTFTLDGKLYQTGSQTPLLDGSAKITVQILDPTGQCLLYEEQQTVDTRNSDGYFTIHVGSATGATKRTINDPGRTMNQIFQNITGITANSVPGQTCAGGTYSPAVGAIRYFRLTVTPSATNVADRLTPDLVFDSVPSAIVAQSVQGLERSNILQVYNSGSTVLTQANLEALFTTPAYTNLQAILGGNFIKTDGSGAALPSYAADPAGASNGDIWFDSTTGQLKYQNSGGVQTIGAAGTGSITSLTMGSSISINGTVAGTISNGSGTIDLTNTGVSAGTYTKVTVDAKGRVTAGTISLVEGDIPNLTVAGKVSGNTITSGTISGSAGINTSGNLITTGTVSGLNVQATNLRVYNGANYIQMTAPALGGNVNLTLPTTDGNPNEFLKTDGNGVLSWASASITSSDVTGALGYTPLNAAATFAGDVSGTYNSTSVDKIKGKAITAGSVSGQMMIYNGTSWVNSVMSGDATMDYAGALTLAKVPVAKGGTNSTTFGNNRIIASNGTGTALVDFTCSLNQVISFDASGNATCAAISSLGGFIANGGNTTGADISIGTNDNKALAFKVNNSTAMTISQNGNVGIGTVSPGAALGINGDIQFTNAAARTLSVADSAAGTDGRSITIQAGGTGVASGPVGGSINLVTGLGGQNSQGGSINMTTAAGSTNSVYGDITMSARNLSFSSPAASSGTVSIVAGSGNTTGGTATFSAGAGGPTNGTGGALTVNGGNGILGGGDALFRAGDAAGNGSTGGNVTLRGGDSSRSTIPGSYAPGTVTIRGGNSGGNNNTANGGNVTISGGAGGVSGATVGGLVTIQGGPAGAVATSVGGSVSIAGAAGSTTGTGGAGGTVTIAGGNAGGTGVNNGGDISLNGGAKTSTGTDGNVILASSRGNVGIGTSNPSSALDISGAVTAQGMSSAPSVSSSNTGRIYYDYSANKFKVSQNGGAYVDLISSGGGITSVGGQSGASQSLAISVDNSVATPTISSASDTHTWKIPMASNTGTTAGLLNKADYDSFVAKLGTTTSFAGDVSGTYNATSVDKIKGKAITAGSVSGQMMIYNGTAWVNSVMSGDATMDYAGALTLAKVPVSKGGTNATSFGNNRIIASNGTGTTLQDFTCSLNQVITFDASGNAACAAVSSLGGFILNGGNTTGADISIGTNDNKALNFKVNNSTAMTISQNGYVGTGNTNPAVALDVQGQIRSRTNDATGTTTVDWNSGNIQYTTDSCQAYTFNNLVDGGSYTFVVKGGTSAQCTFSTATLTYHYTPTNAPTNAGTHTVYTLFRAGSDVYVSWTTGL
jgi:hypothetical protein